MTTTMLKGYGKMLEDPNHPVLRNCGRHIIVYKVCRLLHSFIASTPKLGRVFRLPFEAERVLQDLLVSCPKALNCQVSTSY